jgi:hypothetical protein
MATEMQYGFRAPIEYWSEVPRCYPICEDIQIQRHYDPEFDFEYAHQYDCIHEIEPEILIYWDEDVGLPEVLGSCIVIVRREDFLSCAFENYRFIVLKGRNPRSVSGFKNLVALEVKRLRSR